MTVQTFNPSDLSQSAANWAVAQRSVAAFAPHAQASPNMTIMVDQGFLLHGATLTEVGPQTTAVFDVPADRRVDRVVIDRTTGAVSVVAGTNGSVTPPAIPAGKLPVARVLLLSATTQITNADIVDERALCDLSPSPATQSVVARATLGGTAQSGLASGVYTKINLNTADINTGDGFDIAASRFQPTVAGNYLIYVQALMNMGAGKNLTVAVRKNGAQFANYETVSPTAAYASCGATEIVALNGSTDYVEMFVSHNNGSSSSVSGSGNQTYMLATLLP